MQPKTLLTLLASTSTAAAVSNTINFIYSASSFSGIQGSGSGYSTGFNLVDNDGNTLYSASHPDGYAPCMSDSENIDMTSDCWSGTWTFKCTSAFDGNPESCSAVQPDGILEYQGTVDADLSEIGIAAGTDGTCSGSFTSEGTVACSADATFTITGRSRG
ncbi:hypothetical protein BDV19DRAFT_356557 [Aspergillus venezuelensis]